MILVHELRSGVLGIARESRLATSGDTTGALILTDRRDWLVCFG
jgi:hypothetical protein